MFATSQLKIPFSIINSEILWLSNYVNCYCAICYILALPYTPLLALKSFELVWYHTTSHNINAHAQQDRLATKFQGDSLNVNGQVVTLRDESQEYGSSSVCTDLFAVGSFAFCIEPLS